MTLQQHTQRCQELWAEAKADRVLCAKVDRILQKIAMKEMNAVMKQIDNTIDNALFLSVTQNRIVHLEYSEELHDQMLSLCDDWTNGESCNEYWGTNDEGDEWRVHLDR